MAVQPRLLTAEDLAAFDTGDLHVELVRGELIAMPPTFADHGNVVGSLHAFLGYYIKTNHLGTVYGAETGFLLGRNPDTVRAPDIAFIRSARLTPAASAPNWNPVVPDLVVEVVSTYDRPHDLAEKVKTWLDAGVQLVWVVSPTQRTVVEHRPSHPERPLSANDTLDGGDLVPGFTMPVAQVFE